MRFATAGSAGVGGRNLVPRRRVRLLPLGVRRHLRAQRGLVVLLLLEDARVHQAVLLADEPLDGVLEAQPPRRRAPGLLGAERLILDERVAPRRPHLHLERVAHVALVPDLRHGQQPRRRARVARREDQFALGRAGLRPLEEVRGLRGWPFSYTRKNVMSKFQRGIREVVVVAAEVGDLLLGREHQADVRVLLVAVEPVLAAAVERDDLALQAGRGGAVLLDGGHLGPALRRRPPCRSRRPSPRPARAR